MDSGNGRSTHTTALLRACIRKSGTGANDENRGISAHKSIGTDRRGGVKSGAGTSGNVGGGMPGVVVLGSFFRMEQGCAENLERRGQHAVLGQA